MLNVKVGDILTWRTLNGTVSAEVQERNGELVCEFPNGKMIAVRTLNEKSVTIIS